MRRPARCRENAATVFHSHAAVRCRADRRRTVASCARTMNDGWSRCWPDRPGLTQLAVADALRRVGLAVHRGARCPPRQSVREPEAPYAQHNHSVRSAVDWALGQAGALAVHAVRYAPRSCSKSKVGTRAFGDMPDGCSGRSPTPDGCCSHPAQIRGNS